MKKIVFLVILFVLDSTTKLYPIKNTIIDKRIQIAAKRMASTLISSGLCVALYGDRIPLSWSSQIAVGTSVVCGAIILKASRTDGGNFDKKIVDCQKSDQKIINALTLVMSGGALMGIAHRAGTYVYKTYYARA